jgi:hypothetical protein
MPGKHKRRISVGMLTATLVFSIALAAHISNYDCRHSNHTASQLEHNHGLHGSSVSSAASFALSVASLLVTDAARIAEKQLQRKPEIPRRSPPGFSR